MSTRPKRRSTRSEEYPTESRSRVTSSPLSNWVNDSLTTVPPSSLPYVFTFDVNQLLPSLIRPSCVFFFGRPQNFIQRPLPPGSRTGAGGHDGQPGALGMGQKAAFGLTTFNTFWIYLTPLLGAYLADQYFGRYKTVQLANIICLFGHILLVICAIPGIINKK